MEWILGGIYTFSQSSSTFISYQLNTHCIWDHNLKLLKYISPLLQWNPPILGFIAGQLTCTLNWVNSFGGNFNTEITHLGPLKFNVKWKNLKSRNIKWGGGGVRWTGMLKNKITFY